MSFRKYSMLVVFIWNRRAHTFFNFLLSVITRNQSFNQYCGPHIKVNISRKMVQAWYMDNETNDQRLEHHRNPPAYISLEDLYRKTGVEYFKINIDTFTTDGVLDKLKKERGYTYEDEMVCSKECLANYEEKIKSFFTEHLHTDEEIRLVLDGSGYFDVRDGSDDWIRIAVSAGDMIVIPSGIYHRFTLDTNNFIKAKRFFIGEPVWLPYNRPADDMECRKEYVDKLEKGFAAAC